MFDNIRGIITFEAAAAEPEVFLNALRQSAYSVSDLRYKKGRISGNIYRSDFSGLQKLAEAYERELYEQLLIGGCAIVEVAVVEQPHGGVIPLNGKRGGRD